jgi:hypothetical protein
VVKLGYTSSQGINDGEMIWQKLILTNPNVRLVFSGHVTWQRSCLLARPRTIDLPMEVRATHEEHLCAPSAHRAGWHCHDGRR